jgi:hypothetical protein
VTTGGLGRVTKRIYSGLVGGKILTVRRYCDGREDRYALFSGLVLFRLVAPPLQPGVVGPYPVWDTWFPHHLSYPEFLAITGDPRYPRVQYPVNCSLFYSPLCVHLWKMNFFPESIFCDLNYKLSIILRVEILETNP